MRNASIAIIAGGMSRRFGEDKTLALFRDRPLIDWVAEGATQASDDVMLISKDIEKYAFLHLKSYEDIVSVQCPMVGLLTAFAYARHDRVFMISADIPCFNFDALPMLTAEMERFDSDVSIPYINGRYYPTAALYHKRTEPLFAQMLINKEYKLINAFSKLNVHTIQDFSAYDRDGAMFINVNTPSDLAELERIRKNG